MDPISALIGGGISLLGGIMNRSSVQAANTQNLQQQMSMATGAYLPALRANAEAAGFNPLAVLGLHTPDMAVSRPADASSGVMRLGEFAAQSLSPHNVEMEKLSEDDAKAAIELKRSQLSESSIRAAVNKYTLGTLLNRPDLLPEGVKEPATQTGFGIPQIEWMRNLINQKGYLADKAGRGSSPAWPSLPSLGPTFDERYQNW